MDDKQMQELIERYIRAYNAFDIDGMVALLHPECTFQNVSGGSVNVSAMGIPQFRELAEKSTELFSSRRQTVSAFRRDGDSMAVEVDFEGTLKTGDTLKLHGRSVFRFRDGSIHALTDYS